MKPLAGIGSSFNNPRQSRSYFKAFSRITMVQLRSLGALSAVALASFAKAEGTVSGDALSADHWHWSYPHGSEPATVTKTETCYETETETTTVL